MTNPKHRPYFAIIIIAALTAAILTACGGGAAGVEEDNIPPDSGTGADGVTTYWKHYGTGFGAGASVQETSDGGYIAAGYETTGQSDKADVYVVKTDAHGAVQWQRWFVGTGWDEGHSVQQTEDKGYIVAGCMDCDTNSRNFYLLKLDESGNKVWEKNIPGSSLSGAYGALETRSGTNPDGYVLVGSDLNQGVALIRTNPAGTVLWQKSFTSHAGWDVGFAVEQAAGEGFAITGAYGGGIGLIKAGADGAVQWSKTYGPGEGWSVRQTSDGGYVIAGRTTPSPWFGGKVPGDAIVIRTDKDGNQVWSKTFGGAEDDEARSVALTLDNGYIIAGKTKSYGPGTVDPDQPWQMEDVFLIKLDANGDTIWQKVKGHRPNSSDGAASVYPVSDGGYIVAGNSNAYPNGTVLIAKTDKNGNTVNLGDEDLTIDVPAVLGKINFTNAIDVASAGVRGITLPYDVGTIALTVLSDVANGIPAGDLCNGNDSGYSAAIEPPLPLAAGSTLTVTFDNCASGPGGSNGTLNGEFVLKVDSLTGSLSSNYTVETTISPINVTSAEQVGSLSSSIAGGMRFYRDAVGGNFTELSQSIDSPSPVLLTYSETEGSVTITRVIGPFGTHDSVAASGAYTIGQDGDAATVEISGSTAGMLSVTVLQPVQGAGPGAAPGSGSFRIIAQDKSSMTVTMAGAGVTLAIDTNADNTVDGTISTTWDFLY